MALIPFNNPNIDRIIDSDYEAYTDKLLDEAYGDHGERCYNCYHFDAGYENGKCYCTREEEPKEIDPDDGYCCEDWQPGYLYEEEPEDDYDGAE